MDENSDFSVSLVRSHSSVSCHKIICKFFIMAGEKEIDTSCIYDDFEFLTNRERKFRDDNLEIPSRSALFQNQSKFAPNDKVTFSCRIFLEESTENQEEESMHYHKELDEYKAVCQDMRNLLLNGGDHDLILKVKDREFPVHRHILRSRSSVFKAMLRHDMIQENNGVVDVPDCDPQVMEQFLLYIYCGKVDELNESNVMGLYLAAQKYDKISLKKTCRDFMRNSLSCANICDIIQLAKNDYDKTLLEYATEYFINNINDILPTPEWISFLTANTAAANELLIKASKKWTDENTMLMKKSG